MAETKLSASQIIITASDIGAAGAYETMPEPTSSNVGQIVQYTGTNTTGETTVVSGIVYGTYFAEGDDYNITIDFNKDIFNSYNEYTQTHPITSNPNVSLDIYYDTIGLQQQAYFTVSYNDDNMLEVPLSLTGDSQQDPIAIKTFMASIGFTVANEEDPFDFYGEEPIELVLPTTEGETTVYTNGYFYKCTETWGFVGPVPDATGEPGESMVFALDYDAFTAYLQTKSIVLTGQTTFYLGEDADAETGDSIYVLQDADYVTIEEFPSLADMESTTGITWGGQEDLTGDFPYLAENETGFIVGPTYAWNQINVQPNSGGAQYEYTTELEFEPNTPADIGRMIIKGQQNKCSTAYVRMSVAEYYDDSNEWGEASKDSEYLCILQPTTQSSIKACSRVIALEPYQTIWLDCGTQEENGSPVVMFDLYYNQSDWSESKVKFIFEISCNDPLDITSTKDLDSGVDEAGINVMCVPTPIYDPNSTSDRYLVDGGGYQEWRPIPQSEGLPSQTGQSGKFLTTDGTDASWSDKPLVNTATGNSAIGIGEGTTATGNYSIGCGYYNKANGTRSIVIGYGCETTAANGIIISPVNHKQNQQNLIIGRCNNYIAQDCIVLNSIDSDLGMTPSRGDFVVKNDNNAARVLMSADGTIPTDRFTGSNTTPANAGQYMLTITKDSNGNITRSWEPVVAPSTPTTTPVLQGTSTYWIEDQVTHIISQTITVQGVTASNTIFVAPAPTSSADYAAAGIICTAQNTNQLTFTCTTIPTNDIEVNVVIL